MSDDDELRFLARATSLARDAFAAVELQWHRVVAAQQGKAALGQLWHETQFMILSLQRVRMIAKLVSKASKTTTVKQQIDAARQAFDNAVPNIQEMRDVIDHPEDYGRNVGHNRNLPESDQLQLGRWHAGRYEWFGLKLEFALAVSEAAKLCNAIRQAEGDSNGPESDPGPEFVAGPRPARVTAAMQRVEISRRHIPRA